MECDRLSRPFREGTVVAWFEVFSRFFFQPLLLLLMFPIFTGKVPLSRCFPKDLKTRGFGAFSSLPCSNLLDVIYRTVKSHH